MCTVKGRHLCVWETPAFQLLAYDSVESLWTVVWCCTDNANCYLTRRKFQLFCLFVCLLACCSCCLASWLVSITWQANNVLLLTSEWQYLMCNAHVFDWQVTVLAVSVQHTIIDEHMTSVVLDIQWTCSKIIWQWIYLFYMYSLHALLNEWERFWNM